jgi:hypothetical protein
MRAVTLRGSEDARMIERIELVIRESIGGRVRGLSVEADDTTISISGTTDSYYNKQLVTRAVLTHFAHNTLHNNISVTTPQ